MPLNEHGKKELAEKIKEQRRAVWKGEVTPGRRTLRSFWRKKDDEKKERREQQKEAERIPESYYEVVETDSTEETATSEQLSPGRYGLVDAIGKYLKSIWNRVLSFRFQTKVKQHPRITLTSIPQRDEQETESEVTTASPKIPRLGIALLIMLIFIFAIVAGVAIGYLLASHNLVKI